MIETKDFLVVETLSIKDAMKSLTEMGQKTLFVINKKNCLIGSLSDGDIRKWILDGGSLSESVIKVCNSKPKFVSEKFELKTVRDMMVRLLIECVPVLNKQREVVEILTWENVFSGKKKKKKNKLKSQVVIMAGGQGTRLDPFTRILPKPLIPINDKPIIEIIMDKFSDYGVSDFHVSVNHKSRMIKSYFEDNNNPYRVSYLEEDKPLGTAGSLKFIKNNGKTPILVTNCDILVESDYCEMEKFHRDNNNDITMIVSCRHFVIPYGVCEIENGGTLRAINEKPVQDLLVNTGMYVLNRQVLKLIPRNIFFHITDLISKAKEMGYKVGVFPISEKSWIDIGQWEEYHKAVERMKLD